MPSAGDRPGLAVYPDDELPPVLAGHVRALVELAWPASPASAPTDEPAMDKPAGTLSASGHDPALAPVTMLLLDGTRVIAALTMLTKQLRHAGSQYLVSGVSAVVTDPDYRGRGHGSRLVAEAWQFLSRSGADLAIFTCDRPLAGFYVRAGWTLLAGTVLVGGTPSEPFPSDLFDKVTLGSLFSSRAVRAADSFVQARILLYPGVIDRLW